MTQRLPIPGQDNGTWGTILNGFLGVAHNADGSLQDAIITDVKIASSAAISKTKLAPGVQTSLTSADNTAPKPAAGIDGKPLKWNNSAGQLDDATATLNATYVALSGGTMTGDLVLAGTPAASLGAITKQYVDDQVTNLTAGLQTETDRAIAAEGAIPTPDPNFYGVKGWTISPEQSTSKQALNAATGQATLLAVMVPKTVTAANIFVTPNTVSSTTWTSGQNFAAVISSTGNILASTADLSSSLATITANDVKLLPLSSSTTITGGAGIFVYIYLLLNYTGTAPSFVGLNPWAASNVNLNLSGVNQYRTAYTSATYTALPGSPISLTHSTWARGQFIPLAGLA